MVAAFRAAVAAVMLAGFYILALVMFVEPRSCSGCGWARSPTPRSRPRWSHRSSSPASARWPSRCGVPCGPSRSRRTACRSVRTRRRTSGSWCTSWPPSCAPASRTRSGSCRTSTPPWSSIPGCSALSAAAGSSTSVCRCCRSSRWTSFGRYSHTNWATTPGAGTPGWARSRTAAGWRSAARSAGSGSTTWSVGSSRRTPGCTCWSTARWSVARSSRPTRPRVRWPAGRSQRPARCARCRC